MNENDLMQLAHQSIEEEDARQAANARTEELKAAATEAVNAEGVTLPDIARKFDAAVAALADLANAACTRNDVIVRHSVGIQAAGLRDATSTPPRELLARALATAINQVGTPGNGLNQLASGLLAHSGPLHRLTAVERAAR
ncbi:hypothetical protein [Streptomyces cyaneofuscatus]|uniref:hypothetical protein n=1 Tax=Streptomyces cyaneofuscatus TaxID=66883 RepID=UPI003316E0A9